LRVQLDLYKCLDLAISIKISIIYPNPIRSLPFFPSGILLVVGIPSSFIVRVLRLLVEPMDQSILGIILEAWFGYPCYILLILVPKSYLVESLN
jgi:hypothetical protein